MSFQPVLPIGGLAGWAFLQRTRAAQQEAFSQAPALTRDSDHFRARIGRIDSADALMADRRLLRVVLGAFGLGADIDNRAFIRRILSEPSAAPESLANKLADGRYRAMARAFGFGDPGPPGPAGPGFAERIVNAYLDRRFETAVGERDPAMRLALNADRALPGIAADAGDETTKWLRILGDRPLRRVVEGALGLPGSFANLDLDRQLEVLRTGAARRYGADSVAALAGEEARAMLIRDFMVRQSTATTTLASPGSVALALLTGSAPGASGVTPPATALSPPPF